MPSEHDFSYPRALARGQYETHYARAGDQIICLEGWLGLSVHQPCLYDAVLRAGESYCFQAGGLFELRGERNSLVVYLRTQPVLRRKLSCAVQSISKWCTIRFIRRGVEQSGSSSGS